MVIVWTYHEGSFGGISPANDREWTRAVARDGHAITTDSSHRTITNHRIAGVGIGHDDASFCEAGTSEAAYVENGEAFGGRWWEDTESPFSVGVKHYGCADRSRFGRVGGRTASSETLARLAS